MGVDECHDDDAEDERTLLLFDLEKFRRALRRSGDGVAVIRHGDVVPLLFLLLPLAPPHAQEVVLDAFKWLLTDADDKSDEDEDNDAADSSSASSSASSLSLSDRMSDHDRWAARSNRVVCSTLVSRLLTVLLDAFKPRATTPDPLAAYASSDPTAAEEEKVRRVKRGREVRSTMRTVHSRAPSI